MNYYFTIIFLYNALWFLCHYRREGWPLHVLQTCCFACMPRRQSDLGCLKPRWDVMYMNSQLLWLKFTFYVFYWTIINVFFMFTGWGFSAVPWGTTNTSGSVVGCTFDVWIWVQDLGLYTIISMALFICILKLIAVANYVAVKPKISIWINMNWYIWTAFLFFIFLFVFFIYVSGLFTVSDQAVSCGNLLLP